MYIDVILVYSQDLSAVMPLLLKETEHRFYVGELEGEWLETIYHLYRILF